ncbi:MAG TPA: T9SS type A sorting domain-containing protein, partial [Ferruginibacter sp.]|nr:T9SS type A sorting domain-containing protein [Ferruginibacter sp.]
QHDTHLLNWKLTCTATPGITMHLQRSTSARNYKDIYSLTATALECRQPFNYTDQQPVPGINYYRLKMTAAGGKVSYSTIVSLINAERGIDISSIAPNPVANGHFKLNISAAQRRDIDIVITDMQGRVLQKRSFNMIAGFNTIDMNVTGLAKGTYQLYGSNAAERSGVQRFVIQQ